MGEVTLANGKKVFLPPVCSSPLKQEKEALQLTAQACVFSCLGAPWCPVFNGREGKALENLGLTGLSALRGWECHAKPVPVWPGHGGRASKGKTNWSSQPAAAGEVQTPGPKAVAFSTSSLSSNRLFEEQQNPPKSGL